MHNQEAFVYHLRNTNNGRYYIGYHKGTVDDGYLCSSRNFEFWLDYEQGHSFERLILFFGTKEECKERESAFLSNCFLDKKCYNFSDGNGGFLLRDCYVGMEIETKRLIEADKVLPEYNNKNFLWYTKKEYVKLGYKGISKDIKDTKTKWGRVKLFFRQLIRRLT